ncbi:MAG: AMP-binding protein, partial [bacterium]|nr:AMP-binding protein [bacterium]
GGEKTYADFLREVSTNSLHAFENQDVQFEELVDQLELERDPSSNPLFDVVMDVQPFKYEDTGTSDQLNLESRTSKFDITFFIYQTGDHTQVTIEYYAAIFKPVTIQRLASHFQNVIKAVTHDPSVTLDNIEIITADEKKKVLDEFNDTTRQYPEDKTIHRLFEEQVERTPDRVAVTINRKALTYTQLNKKSTQLAFHLMEKGVQPGTDSIVAIMVERSLEMIIGIFGILKAGAAYLPIEMNYPQERIDFMLKDSGARILLNRHAMESLTHLTNHDQLLNFPTSRSTSIAYIIYTSGTTGKPKGV